MEIKILEGHIARPLVDPFYERVGSRTRARDTDVFFVALKANALSEASASSEPVVVIGSVRFCIEEGVALLRGMQVARDHQRRGVGMELLEAFKSYVMARGIEKVLCLPYTHLESFYASIGFMKVNTQEGPEFLQARLSGYLTTQSQNMIMMAWRV